MTPISQIVLERFKQKFGAPVLRPGDKVNITQGNTLVISTEDTEPFLLEVISLTLNAAIAEMEIAKESISMIDHPYTTEEARTQFNHVKHESTGIVGGAIQKLSALKGREV